MEIPAHSPSVAHASGPLTFLNTTTRYHPVTASPSSATIKPATAPGIYHVWRSRDNRKGRHAAIVGHDHGERKLPRATNTLAETVRGLLKLVTRYPVWDVSYDVAVVFTLGSVVWCINGFFVWYPLAAPWSEFPGETDAGGGWTAFIGATIFEVGSVLLMLEAVNENRTDCFGWALEEALEDDRPRLHTTPDACRHHHRNKHGWLRNAFVAPGALAAAVAVPPLDGMVGDHDDAPKRSGQNVPRGSSESARVRARVWSWWPTWHEVTTHYLREVGFLACLAQMVGATIFWIAGFTALAPINSALSTPALNGVYWLPQVVGGTGFIVSSLLFMVEVQDKWYLPAPKMLGWHVGFWNLVGAIGFTLCGALGFAVDVSESIEYALTLSTFVGSWAFLIGSVVQWYESLDKYPISIRDAPSFLSSASKAP